MLVKGRRTEEEESEGGMRSGSRYGAEVKAEEGLPGGQNHSDGEVASWGKRMGKLRTNILLGQSPRPSSLWRTEMRR